MSVAKHYLSADAYLRDIWRLSAAIRRSDWKPDYLVGLWRGGAPVGISVHEFLKQTGWNLKHLPLKCASYTGIGANDGEVVFTHGEMVFDLLKPGMRILFLDDVFDSGKTAAAIHRKVAETGAEMRLGCVYWKPAKNVTDFKPDYYVRDVGNDWIVFPHEIDGLTADEIREKDPLLSELLAIDSST